MFTAERCTERFSTKKKTLQLKQGKVFTTERCSEMFSTKEDASVEAGEDVYY